MHSLDKPITTGNSCWSASRPTGVSPKIFWCYCGAMPVIDELVQLLHQCLLVTSRRGELNSSHVTSSADCAGGCRASDMTPLVDARRSSSSHTISSLLPFRARMFCASCCQQWNPSLGSAHDLRFMGVCSPLHYHGQTVPFPVKSSVTTQCSSEPAGR